MGDERSGYEWDGEKELGCVERVLKALGQAQPPEGLEARVAARIAARSERQEVSAGSSLAAVWWRGAVSGAVAALLFLAGGAAALHQIHFHDGAGGKNVGAVLATNASGSEPAARRSVVMNGSAPCALPAVAHLQGIAPGLKHKPVPAERAAMKTAAVFDRTMTPQERALIQLTQRVDPKQLADLNPEMRAKMEAQDAAEFEQFFAAQPKSTGDEE